MDRNLEMLLRAKQYLEQLANGHDPFSGAELPDDTVVNNVKISRCFFYVADVLQQVINNGGEVGRKPSLSSNKKLPFTLTDVQLAQVQLSDEPLFISRFCERIDALIDTKKMRKCPAAAFGKWLLYKGYFTMVTHDDRELRKVTDAGIALGIREEWSERYNQGNYLHIYTRTAQQFLLDNLADILAYQRESK